MSAKKESQAAPQVNVQEMIDGLAAKAKAALEEYMALSQEQVDEIAHAMALAGLDNHTRLAKLAVEETGRGVYEDKIIKNLFATEYIWHDIKSQKTVGIIEDDELSGIVQIAEPVGIVAGVAIVLPTGTVDFMSLLSSMGSGAAGMFETIMVTVLVSAMCALIREFGGFEALLAFIRRVFKGRVGGRLGVGLLVGAMDIATANNTVAIVMAGPIAREISEEYNITPKESASLLDTFSCVFQGVIPYGAQMLVAISASGGAVSAFQIMPCLYYPYLLAAASIVYILVGAGKKSK